MYVLKNKRQLLTKNQNFLTFYFCFCPKVFLPIEDQKMRKCGIIWRCPHDRTIDVETEIQVRDANCRWSGVYTGLNPTAALGVLDLARCAPTFRPKGRWFERL